jgi:hypothetical protein
MLLGGTNGLTNFYKPLGTDTRWILGLYLVSVAALIAMFLVCRALVRSRFGRVLVAIRDNEPRLYFLGYRADAYKALVFVAAAVVAAIGGMLYVPQNGIVTPNTMRVEDSIWMVIWVAVGGRGTLWGSVMGAIMAMFTYSTLTSDMPRTWPFIQGGLFLTVLAFPGGAGELWSRLEREVKAGATIRRALAAFVFVEGFLIAEKMSWLKFLPSTAVAGLPIRYAIPLAIAVILCWNRRTARVSTPLLAISWFIATQALGVMPPELSHWPPMPQFPNLEVPGPKYLLVVFAIGRYAWIEGEMTARLVMLCRRILPKALAGAAS